MTTLSVNVQKQLGDFTLDAAFTSAGGVTALFGPSGAGKTSVIAAIAGLIKPQRGRIVPDGDALFDADQRIDVKPWKRRIAMHPPRALAAPRIWRASVTCSTSIGRSWGRRAKRRPPCTRR